MFWGPNRKIFQPQKIPLIRYDKMSKPGDDQICAK